MWVIAGLLIGSIMFVAGSTLLAKYLHSQDIGLARSNFNQLADTARKICRLGIYSEETLTLHFPSAASRISADDRDGVEGEGNELCLAIKGEDGKSCLKADTCDVTMNSVVFEEAESSLLQKISGNTKASVFTFKVTKTGVDAVQITWKPN